MSRVVYKYPIESNLSVTIPGQHKVLHVGIDPKLPNTICVWAELDMLNGSESKTEYFPVGTGHAVFANWFHVGSVIHPNGLVWHVYGETK